MDDKQQRMVSNLVFLDARDRCLDGLRDRGVVALCLKGCAFLETLYALDERRMSDIDLLIRVGDREIAQTWALHNGYEPVYPANRPASRRDHYNWSYRNPQFGIMIEFHSHFAQAQRHPMRMEGFFERSVRVCIGERTIDTLAAEDHLLHLAIHGGKDSYSGWEKSAEDGRRLIAKHTIAWPALVERATEAKTRTNLYVLLRRIALLQGPAEQPVPADLVDGLRPAPHRMAALSLLIDFETGESRYRHSDPWVRYVTLPLAVESKRCLAHATLRHIGNVIQDRWTERTG